MKTEASAGLVLVASGSDDISGYTTPGGEEFIVAQRTASLACSICVSQKYFVTHDCRTREFMRDYLSPVPEY
jgi:hypothetical protein